MNQNIRNRLGWASNQRAHNNNYQRNHNGRTDHRLPNFKIQRTGQRNFRPNSANRTRRAGYQIPAANPVANGVVPIPCQCRYTPPAPPVLEACVSMCATVPLIMYNTRVTAALSSGSTFTKVGKHIANLAIRNNCLQASRVFEYQGVRKTIRILTIPMGARTGRTKPIECIIDKFAPPMGIILGLAGMKTLSYRIMVDRVVAEHHGPGASEAQQNQSARSQMQPINEESHEGDFIEALTEAELREIDNWEKE